METKPFWASKTIWVNLIAGAAAVTTAFGLNLGLDGETQTALVGGIMAVANIVLRVITSTKLTGG
ncbi:MAG: hypothetical protein RQ750_12260 [Roseovarius sp.]|nr:hypothetical protein [Roseovarius sp.]